MFQIGLTHEFGNICSNYLSKLFQSSFAQLICLKYEFTVNLKMGLSLPGGGGILKNEIQGFPESRSIVKKLRLVKKASVVADEQMVNWKRKLKCCLICAPGMAGWLFGRQPGEHSRQHLSQLHAQEIRHRCQSPSSQICFWDGEQGRTDSTQTAWFLLVT